jgi:hypothetical protein
VGHILGDDDAIVVTAESTDSGGALALARSGQTSDRHLGRAENLFAHHVPGSHNPNYPAIELS